MDKAQPAAGTRPPERAPRAPADESVPGGSESLWHHVKRSVHAGLIRMVCGVLDPCIALLQGLRPHTGGAQDAGQEEDGDRQRSRSGRPGGRRDASEREEEGGDESEAPRPKRRLLTYLIYFSVLLAGGMIGGALAYELLAKVLDRQATEVQRVQAALSKQTKSAVSNEKKFAEAQTKRAQAEKKLEEAQKKQSEAEKKLEAALNDSKAAAEKQKKLDDAVKLLEQIRGPDRSGTAPRLPPASSGSAERNPRSLKSGDCTLGAGDVKGLKDCVKEFNR